MDLDRADQLALWAAGRAEHVPPLFDKQRSNDVRLRGPSRLPATDRREIRVSEARNAA
jgi:hypothetical protein